MRTIIASLLMILDGVVEDPEASARPSTAAGPTSTSTTRPASEPCSNIGMHPVFLGSGRRLFDGAPAGKLRLVAAAPQSSGVVGLTYAP